MHHAQSFDARPSRTVVTLVTLLAAVSGAFLLALPHADGQQAGREPTTHPGAQASPADVLPCEALTKMLLAELGVAPQSLAAIDASDQQVRAIVVAARAMCATQTATFASAQRDVEQARGGLQSLESLQAEGRATADTRQRLAAARFELSRAAQARAQVVDQVRGIVTNVLTEPQRAQLANIRAAQSTQPSVPIEYTTTTRTESELVAIRDTLAEQRTQAPTGEPARSATSVPPAPLGPPAFQDPQTQIIAARIEQRLPSIRTAWAAAMAN